MKIEPLSLVMPLHLSTAIGLTTYTVVVTVKMGAIPRFSPSHGRGSCSPGF